MEQFFDRAVQIAAEAHRGQKDKAGAPYILHVLRVMMSLEEMDEKIVALLHDVVEDSGITLLDLTKENFPSNILTAVDLLTKKENQPYEDYIFSIKSNLLAKAVKMADLEDNMNSKRLKNILRSDKLRIIKYQEAYGFLNS